VRTVITLAKGDAQVILRSGASVPCSRQYRAQLIARLPHSG
jgi:two-component system LytT family response regulator